MYTLQLIDIHTVNVIRGWCLPIEKQCFCALRVNVILLTTHCEPVGVECGAHINGEDDVKSRLPVEPDGLWLLTANEFVSAEGV